MPVQSVHRALDLLEAVALQGGWVGVRELARLTGLKPPTAQNLLKTLTRRGYLDFDAESRRYRVGIQPLQLARAIDPAARLGELAARAMREASREFGETGTTCTMVSGQVMITDVCDSSHEVMVKRERQVVQMPHHLASGMVLVAYQDEEFRRRYVTEQELPPMANLTSDPRELLREFEQVRRQGYAQRVNVGGLRVAAVAVPVRGAGGRVQMTLALSGPMERMNRGKCKAVREFLQGLAATIEQRLGSGDKRND